MELKKSTKLKKIFKLVKKNFLNILYNKKYFNLFHYSLVGSLIGILSESLIAITIIIAISCLKGYRLRYFSYFIIGLMYFTAIVGLLTGGILGFLYPSIYYFCDAFRDLDHNKT